MKTLPRIIAALALLALLAAPAGPAAAAETLAFAGQVQVDGGKVTLLSLAAPDQELSPALKDALASVTVAGAPGLGRSVVIHGSRIKSLLRQAHLGPGVSVLLPEQVLVERASQTLSSQALAQLYIQAVSERLGARAKDADIRDVDTGRDLALPAGKLTTSLRLVGLSGEPSGRVPAAVDVYVDGRKEAQVRVVGNVDVYGQVVVAARPLMGKHVIAAEDVELVRVNLSEAGLGALGDIQDAVGLRTRAPVPAGAPLDLRRLEQAPLIRRGDVVTMVFTGEGLKITAKGKAEQIGFAGGRIRLTNLNSKREVWGKVLDSGTVVVEF